MIFGVRTTHLATLFDQALTIPVTREDINTLKDDWLTDNVSRAPDNPLIPIELTS